LFNTNQQSPKTGDLAAQKYIGVPPDPFFLPPYKRKKLPWYGTNNHARCFQKKMSGIFLNFCRGTVKLDKLLSSCGWNQ